MSAVFNSSTGARGALKKKRVQATFTRPADTTAYAAGDVVGPVTTPAMQTLSDCAAFKGGSGRIIDVMLECNLATITNGSFRIHFFNASHTPAADNAALATLHANADEYQGYCDVVLVAMGGAGVGRNSGKVESAEPSLPIHFVCASADDDLFVVIEALAAYTPSSGEVFRLSAVVEQD
jgi:hypothetical protein